MTPEEIQYQITQLHYDNQSAYSTRGRIRAIMNGGPDGLLALLGDQIKGFQDFQIPVPNLMMSGLEHLSQKIGRIPNLKVDVPNNKDSDRARAKADKIARIVTSYDDTQKLDLQMPQVGRWLPGYGFAVWVIREKKDLMVRHILVQNFVTLTTVFLVTLVQINNQKKWLLFVEFLKNHLHRFIQNLQKKLWLKMVMKLTHLV